MARSHKWGRSQKYHDRPRYLYALLFQNGCCYVGQSVDPGQRLGQHRRVSGGWAGQPFRMIELGVVLGTQADAERHEFAWRYSAFKAGWRIYGKPGILVDPRRRLTLGQRMLSWSLKWPKAHRNQSWAAANWGWMLLGMLVVMWIASVV